MMFVIIAVLIAVLAIATGKKGFCHYGCWMAPFMIIGTKAKERLKLPSLRLKADRFQCIDCKRCNKNCPMSLDVNSMVTKSDMSNSECILCLTCVDNCPKGVISL